MKNGSNVVNVEEVREFFFEGASKEFAAGKVKKLAIKELPGYKLFFHENEGGTYVYADVYYLSPTTGRFKCDPTIWRRDTQDLLIPTWGMQNHGIWRVIDKRLTSFLKAALLDAYENKVFYGGRGRAMFPHKPLKVPEYHSLKYQCSTLKNDFTHFHSDEYIEENGEVLYEGECAGFSL